MVILQNIKLGSNGIECNYNPEKSGKLGHIEISNDGSVKVDYSEYEYGKLTYAQKAIDRLDVIKNDMDTIPNESIVMWY